MEEAEVFEDLTQNCRKMENLAMMGVSASQCSSLLLADMARGPGKCLDFGFRLLSGVEGTI